MLYTTKSYAALLCALLGAQPAIGQFKNEVSLHGGGGLSTFSYTLRQGRLERGGGGELGLGYTRFLSRSFGVGTGVSLSRYSAAALLDGVTAVTPNLTSLDGVSYDLRSELLGYREQQQATFVHVPLMLSFQGRRQHPLYAQAGVKVAIPLSARYESRSAALRTEGYFPSTGFVAHGPSYMGFGDFDGITSKGTLNLKLVYAASAEAGVKWRISRVLSLYTTLYADYGLTEAASAPRSESIVRTSAANPESFTTASVIASQYSPGEHAAGKVSLMGAGVRLRIAFGASPFARRFSPDSHQTIAAISQQLKENMLAQQQRFAEALRRLEAAEARLEAAEARREAAEAQREAGKGQREAGKGQPLTEEDALRQKVAEIRRQRAQGQKQHSEAWKIIEQPVGGYTINQKELTEKQKAGVNKKIPLLQQNPSISVICVGYTCNLGSEAANLHAGRLRAEKMKKYLVKQGIDERRISLLSEGRQNPLVPNINEKNRRLNRRVELLVVE